MQDGLFAQIAVLFGGKAQNYLANPAYFRTIYVLSDIWSGIGWNSIIYLAALSSIDQEQYEAARVDGANRFQRIIHVDLPGYGYAKVSQAEKAKWGKMIENYLHKSKMLRCVFLLLDIRHEPSAKRQAHV